MLSSLYSLLKSPMSKAKAVRLETGRRTTPIPPSSSSPTLANTNRNETESQRSTDESIDSVFGSVPTHAEADYSLTAFQSFMNQEGSRMLVDNPGFQPVQTAFKFMRMPKVQDTIVSLMCDINVIAAVLKNDAVLALLRSLTLGDSTKRRIIGVTGTAAANSSQSQGSENEHGLVSMVLNWLLDNIGSGFLGIFGSLMSLTRNTVESPQNGNIGSGSSSEQVFQLTMFLSVINLLIVFVRRALKHKLMV